MDEIASKYDSTPSLSIKKDLEKGKMMSRIISMKKKAEKRKKFLQNQRSSVKSGMFENDYSQPIEPPDGIQLKSILSKNHILGAKSGSMSILSKYGSYESISYQE